MKSQPAGDHSFADLDLVADPAAERHRVQIFNQGVDFRSRNDQRLVREAVHCHPSGSLGEPLRHRVHLRGTK